MAKAPDIPKDLSAITPDWVLDLALYLNGLERQEEKYKVIQVDIGRHEADSEGVLSDILKVFCHLELRKDPGSHGRTVMYNWFVKVIPRQMSDLVQKAQLFQKEIAFYRDVVPYLQEFVRNQSPTFKLKHFKIPKYYYGDTIEDGKGVLVLQDCSMKGFKSFDGITQLMDLEHLQETIQSLAEFHALSISHDITNESQGIVERFPIFHSGNLMWLQDEMTVFLSDMVQKAQEFLDNVPGEQELTRHFSQHMSNPSELLKSALNHSSQFRCLQHGDSWHNNFIFHRSRQTLRSLIVDWQISFLGHAPNDVCYLIYSSTTRVFRMAHQAELLKLYFETLTLTIKSLGLNEELFDPSFEEFKSEVTQSLGWCLLFCGSPEDFQIEDPSASPPLNESHDPEDGSLPSPSSLLTDKEVQALEQPYAHRSLSYHTKRALRRKNYLDIYREAMLLGVI